MTMGELAMKMLRESLDAFVGRDVQLAQEVLSQDDWLDAFKGQVFRELLTYMDFGTARAQGAERGTASYLHGTPAYMPPEQLLGHELDGRTDLYAVGVLFYRLVTGALPFFADTAIEAMRKQISDAPTPAFVHRPDLPEWCDRISQRAMAKLPADRFQTADEFREALRLAAQPAAPAITARPRRSRLARPLIGATATAVSLLAMATLRAPSAPIGDVTLAPEAPEPVAVFAPLPLALPAPQPLPPEVLPEKSPVSHETAFAFEARVLTGTPKTTTECKCLVVLANGRITWRAADDPKSHAVAFDRVASMVYSHGRDPLWMGPGGPTPVVQGNRGPFSVFGLSRERDWVSLRLTESRLQFLVLRFDEAAEAKDAISALEERVGLPIERLLRRRSCGIRHSGHPDSWSKHLGRKGHQDKTGKTKSPPELSFAGRQSNSLTTLLCPVATKFAYAERKTRVRLKACPQSAESSCCDCA